MKKIILYTWTQSYVKSELKHYLAILGENKNMQISHSAPYSNRLLENTIYNNIYKENINYLKWCEVKFLTNLWSVTISSVGVSLGYMIQNI